MLSEQELMDCGKTVVTLVKNFANDAHELGDELSKAAETIEVEIYAYEQNKSSTNSQQN